MPPKKVSASSTFLVDVAMIKLSSAMFQRFFLYVDEKASAMNDSTNTLSVQMMLNQTMLMRSLAEAVDKCPPNGGYCRTKVSVFITQSPLLRS